MQSTPADETSATRADGARVFLNARGREWRMDGAHGDSRAFHRGLPGYEATRLHELPQVARRLGLGRVLVKDESDRFGLPAFKMLGASYAVHRAIGAERPTALVTATDGNHGRAVARTGRLLGVPVRVHVPVGVHRTAVAAIEAEGATVHPSDADYDEAVRRATADATELGALLVQDTAWPGYEEIPGWIVEGYATLFHEIEDELGERGQRADAVLMPVGVGSLALAGLTHFRDRSRSTFPALVSVEPDAAACVLASLRAGELTSVEAGETIMAGLNCGTPSSAAWPALQAGLDGAVSVSDAECAVAAAELRASGVDAGPCGAATLAGLQVLLGGGVGHDASGMRGALGLTEESTVVLLSTEGSAANPALGA